MLFKSMVALLLSGFDTATGMTTGATAAFYALSVRLPTRHAGFEQACPFAEHCVRAGLRLHLEPATSRLTRRNAEVRRQGAAAARKRAQTATIRLQPGWPGTGEVRLRLVEH